ncbi:cobyrinate a,c-diamide synthase [Sphingomonas sp. PR090111-T3T-6A]|uniref:cobyrinate a,c-diamide synthase n=1 Tax=Sphingomonas sp. PR090111-T3T-6A TaxID=685778 RepID=UPI00035CE59A|nr:cobyrinate a,c-diamide synthase [Sphingomonas sp. PR090111-T3T-6A]
MTGLVIAAPRSGSGKTMVSLGLMRAFTRAGLRVQPFKTGPDYIDTAFHAAACGQMAFNLDGWAMGGDILDAIAGRAGDVDLAIAEGAMGLFDGAAAPGETGRGATADIAAHLGWPVLLVMDVSGQSQSAAAVAYGLRSFRPDVHVVGVILNKVASERHERLIRGAMEHAGIAVLGAIPRLPDVRLPERHLGLMQAAEHPDLDHWLDRFADVVTAHVDLPAVRALARPGRQKAAPPLRCTPPGQRIALAQDVAFSFTYAHLLEGWRAAGAEILPFSPLADEAPAQDADIVWLPGGYPELHAGRIAAASRFLTGLRDHAMRKPIHGECGGYMTLGAALVDAGGEVHRMAGLLGLVSSHAERRLHLGYRTARLHAPVGAIPGSTVLRGHEFRYARIVEQPDEPLADVIDAEGRAVSASGSRRGHVTGTFFHLVATGGAPA